jgi:two-component system OmpR family sensor kinase
VVSPGSFIRSAAQATFSAYRSVPIRWRLAGGSAALTLIILASFAAVVGVLTDRQVTHQFVDQMTTASTQLGAQMHPRYNPRTGTLNCSHHIDLSDFAKADDAQIRVFDQTGDLMCTQDDGYLTINQALRTLPHLDPPVRRGNYNENGYRVVAQPIKWQQYGSGWLVYARPLSAIDSTIAGVRGLLVIGVFGGTLLALLAGLATAQRAIRPIAQLTDAAREIERTRDPTRHVPHPKADDEVAELARTLEGMLAALDAARSETEAALNRQREFVADASHELRTPLTSVLANLELLADELDGEPAESAKSALRSTRRMRRLVGDLLLLARADAERQRATRRTELAEVLLDAAAELGAGAGGFEDHELTIDPGSAVVEGSADDLHRLALNLMENAVRHTPPGTHIRAWSGMVDGRPTLVVEDDGPGIPAELRRRVFDRFVRGGGDTAAGARGTGLGLAIVRAVADGHGASVELGDSEAGPGTRFVITFKDPTTEPPDHYPSQAALPADASAQTSTTTGSTIGRRRSRS